MIKFTTKHNANYLKSRGASPKVTILDYIPSEQDKRKIYSLSFPAFRDCLNILIF